MEPLEGAKIPEVNYMQLLQEELDSCCMPSIKDVSRASSEDIVRDMYRVLTGNGNVTGGLIVKVASANVNMQILHGSVKEVTNVLNKQVDRCNNLQNSLEKRTLSNNIKNDILRKTLTFIWENKTFIGTALIAIFLYFNGLMTLKTNRDETDQLIKQLDTKVKLLSDVRKHNPDVGKP